MARFRRTRVGLVSFVTRQGCPMCEQAQPLVERVAAEAGVPCEVLDVDADPALAQWSDHVPVVLLDGSAHTRWWVDEGALRKALGQRV